MLVSIVSISLMDFRDGYDEDPRLCNAGKYCQYLCDVAQDCQNGYDEDPWLCTAGKYCKYLCDGAH